MSDTTAELLQKHFDLALEAPEGITKLRELILTLAMKGKLVPQDPNDPPASVLLKEIEAERKQLIDTGKLKLTRSGSELREIDASEQLFELPAGWLWTRLGMMGETNIGLTYSPSDVSDIGIPVLRSSNVQKGILDFSDLLRVNIEVKASALVSEGDLLICARNGSKSLVGKTAMITGLSEPMAFGAFMAIFRSKVNFFLLRFINSPLFRRMIDEVNTMTINQITQENLRNTLFPLPPLPEQRRIVAKIDQLMAVCDDLEKKRDALVQKRLAVHNVAIRRLLEAEEASEFSSAWDFLMVHFGEVYSVKENVAELRKAILQLAVMGKLVKQDPNDPPTSELLKEIEAEKQRLVKEGKIKTPKPLPPISPEEVPFAIPMGWAWVRFSGVNDVVSELVPSSEFPEMYQIAPDSIEKGTGRLLEHRTVDECGVTGPNNRFYKGQILYSKIRPSLNKVVIAPYDGLCSADMYPVRTWVESDFMLKAMLSEVFLVQVRQAENRVKMPKLNLESLGKFTIPLPPLPEQRRIVAKLDQIMFLCDRLEAQIESASSKKSRLLRALITRI